LRQSYIEKLNEWSNTGILLGQPSDNLCPIDFDTNAAVEAFLQINAVYRTTLRTRGEQGEQLWAYVEGNRPHKVEGLFVNENSPLAVGARKLAKDGKVAIGEFRAEGGQSVLRGIHPSGCHYSWIVANPPITIDFDEIRWPNDIIIPWGPNAQERKTDDNDPKSAALLKRAIALLPVDKLWDLAGFPPRNTNPTDSPFRTDNTKDHPSFSVYDQGRRFKDHNASYLAHRGDSYNFYQLWTGLNSRDAFVPFVKLAGLGHELRRNDIELTGAENDCPYPPVDWSLAKQGDNVRFNHPAIYPKDSILDPFMDTGRTICEGADCYLLGSILPVVAAMLDRSIYLQWGAGKIYPNVFNLLVGKAGDRKSSTIQISTRIALECLPANAFLPHLFSPESMFDEYFERPDKIWLVDDANPILNDWKLSSNGERVAARFLPLYDCGRLTESFRKNKSETSAGRREVPETSTSVLFGATFNVAAFQGQQIRAGLARRFLDYIADAHGRLIVRPDKVDLSGLINLFKPILRLKGEVDFSPEAFTVWDQYQRDNRNQLDAADILNEPLCSRLSSAPTHVQKISMLFESCRCAYRGTTIKEIKAGTLELAIQHVEENMKSAAFLESIAERAVTAKSAELVLATVRNKFPASRPRTIYATRSGLTYELCKHGGRQGALTTDDLYNQVIPYLETQNLAQTVLKKGNLTVFAFQTEQE
jgi:hypothetical protein